VILRFNGIDILDYNHLITMVSITPIGQSAPLVVWRDGKVIEAEVAVADRDAIVGVKNAAAPARPGPEGLMRRPRPNAGDRPATDLSTGLQLTAVGDEAAAKKFGLPATSRGVVVSGVETDAAMASILERNDLIEAIDGKPVRTVEDVRMALSTRGEHSVQFERLEKGATQSRLVHIDVP
jgi:S1-C subfamily serine protease